MRSIQKHIILILSLMTLVFGLAGCGIQKQLKRADKKYAIGEYYEAAQLYKKIYPKIKRNQKALKAEVAFKQGECYRIINHPRAVNAYKNAITYKYQLVDSIVYLRQAQVLHYQGKYSDALRGYEIYLESHPTDYVAQAGRYACMQM